MPRLWVHFGGDVLSWESTSVCCALWDNSRPLVFNHIHGHPQQVCNPNYKPFLHECTHVHSCKPLQLWLEHKHHVWFIIIYALIFFLSNFGPNSTTVPIEIYLARFRSTLHGFCVAFGKIDAIVVGAFIFNYIAQSKTTPSLAGPNPKYLPRIGLRNTVFILLSLNFLGLALTFFIPETHQKPLKDLTGGKWWL